MDTADLITHPMWSRLSQRGYPVLFYPTAKRQICLTILGSAAIWPPDSGAIAVPLSRFEKRHRHEGAYEDDQVGQAG
jgi:hypothetical protein